MGPGRRNDARSETHRQEQESNIPHVPCRYGAKARRPGSTGAPVGRQEPSPDATDLHTTSFEPRTITPSPLRSQIPLRLALVDRHRPFGSPLLAGLHAAPMQFRLIPGGSFEVARDAHDGVGPSQGMLGVAAPGFCKPRDLMRAIDF